MTDSRATPSGAPNGLHWFRNSAERVVLYHQSYAFARRLVIDWLRERKIDETKKPWAVVVDIDETVLDNSEYQQRLVVTGHNFEASTWDNWVNERKAPAFAQAREFAEWVHNKGGKVIAVTDRDVSLCGATRDNLKSERVPVDAVLCAPANATPPKKEARFKAIREGTAGNDLGPLDVALYVGDQVADCAGQTQTAYDKEKFGESCIALPNPMYGAWASNPYH
jgi:5'-nucleotidase (lipoprotein e(P4) family)